MCTSPRGRFGRRLFASPDRPPASRAPRRWPSSSANICGSGPPESSSVGFFPASGQWYRRLRGWWGSGPVRTFVPMGIASAIWYGGITLLGAFIGAEWGRIMALISRVNRTLGIAAGVLIVGIIVWRSLVARRRRRGAGVACHEGCTRSGGSVVSRRHRHRRGVGPPGSRAARPGARLCRSRADAHRPGGGGRPSPHRTGVSRTSRRRARQR